MRCIIATDSFKGSNSAGKVCEAIREGMEKIFPEADYVIVPVADGGEGTTESVLGAVEGELRKVQVTGPLGSAVEASFGILPGGRAVMEMAEASGLPLLSDKERNAWKSTTYGTGELIAAALDAGCREIMIGIGGSATNDCGVGMAQALGVSFRDQEGNEIGYGGGELSRIASIDISNLDERIKDTKISVACDVTNPLCGPKGASFTYGPQKGADPEEVKALDQALAHCAALVERDLGVAISDLPGSGAAGGLGGGLVGFLGAVLEPGIDAVLSVLRFDELVSGADLVITGEGKLDHQTVYGKVPAGVASWVKRAGDIPVIAIAGDIGDGFEAVYEAGIDVVISTVNRAMPLSEAMGRSHELLVETGERVARLLKIGRTLK
jgi:glycerate 2-kinase